MTGMCKCGHPGSAHSSANGMCYHTKETTKDKKRRDCPCQQFRPVVMLTKEELRKMIYDQVRDLMDPLS